MIRFTKILCPIDFSVCAQAAIPIACVLARDAGARLELLHVRPLPVTVMGEFGAIPPEPRDSDEALIARMRQCVPAKFTGVVDCMVKDGDAAEEILKAVHQRHCDLVVLSTHGRTGLGRLLMGSVAEEVLRAAPCPVLTIKSTSTEMLAAPKPTKVVNPEPDIDTAELVTVCSVANPVEADVIRNALKGEQIPSFVEGATQAGFVGTLGIPIRIQVRVGDLHRASKFIQSAEAHRR